MDDATPRIAPDGSPAVVGEPGSGKTTTARMIAGLERPTAGTIELNGRARPGTNARTSERRSFAREAQMVFQDPYASLDRRKKTGDRIAEVLVVMRHGRVIESGAATTVLTDPQHPYTRKLLASVPVPGWKPSRALTTGRS